MTNNENKLFNDDQSERKSKENTFQKKNVIYEKHFHYRLILTIVNQCFHSYNVGENILADAV